MNLPSPSAAESRLRRRAQQYIETQQLAAAQATLESLVQRVPHDASARMELARVMLRRGQLRASNSQLLQVAQTIPDDALLIIQLVQRLYFGGEILAARACLERLERLPSPSAQLQAAWAHLRWVLGEIPASKTWMDRAMAAGIDTPDEHHMHAMLSQFTGDIAHAEEVLERCLRRWPRFGSAAMALANLRKQTPETHHLDFLHEQLRRIPQGSADSANQLLRAQFDAAVFKELDDLGRYDEAWLALARSKALMRALNPYDAAGETAVTDALISRSSSIAASSAGPVPDVEGPTPIFIVGMPRSGTTLLDRMLSSHSEVVSAGEISDFICQLHWVADVPPGGVQGMLNAIRKSADIDFAELGARYLTQTQWRAQGHRFYIDKLPMNVQMVPFIRRALPNAPILHMVREPMDVCFSNFRAMFGDVSPYSNDLPALVQHYGHYVRLTKHWRATMPDAMLDVSYEMLVHEPNVSLRQVLKHCGLDIEERCLHPERNAAPVATPSSVQVREPIHTRGLGQWRHYANELEPLQVALEGLPQQTIPNP
ncbi:MAG: tetratricopeptide repeat-containing sulfotransferase family protein [Rhodanobacter sp.]